MQACYLAGGETQLARELNVPVEALVSYLVGDIRIPNDLFLKAVDFVLANHKKRVAEDGKWLTDFLKRHHRR
jgi:hypothetical protein